MSPEEIDDTGFREIINGLEKQIAKMKTKEKMYKHFIKQLAAAYRMTAPMHYIRTCPCDVCVLVREARKVTA